MASRIKLWVPPIILVLVLLSCNLPRANNDTSPSESTSLAEPPGVTDQAGASRDLSAARLDQADLPAGFEPLSEQEMANLGFSLHGLLQGISANLSNARPQNYAGYLNPNTNEVVVSSIVAPLTVLEQVAFDIYLGDPQRVLGDISQGTAGQQLELDDTSGTVGNSSLGVTTRTEGPLFNLAGGGVISRRGEAIQIAMHFYFDGTTPAVTAQQVANIVDNKLQAALQ